MFRKREVAGREGCGVCGVGKGRETPDLQSSAPTSSSYEFVRIWVSLQGRVPSPSGPYCPAGKPQMSSASIPFPFSYGVSSAAPIAGGISFKGLNLEALTAEEWDECKKPSGSQDSF